jgi:rare lipoprotein A
MNFRFALCLVGAAWIVSACAGTKKVEPVAAAPAPASSWQLYQTGIASWYGGRRHHGRPTASGERFDQNAMTAAHRRLPFKTRVRVTNLKTGRWCIVRINDRGPYVRGRVIDLSLRAAREIGAYNQGLAKVRIEVADPGSWE